MTRFHGRFTRWQSKVVILRLKSPSKPQMRETSKPYHSVFPTHFDLRICYLPLYYLLTFLCQPRLVCSTAVSYYCLMVRVTGFEPVRPESWDFLTTLCHHSHISVLQSGVRLYHILFRLRQLVYTLYTFINNRLFLKLHLSISLLVWAVTPIFMVPTSPSCPSTYYLIQHGVLYSPSPFQPASTLRISSQALSAIIIQQYPCFIWIEYIKVPGVCQFHHTRKLHKTLNKHP